MSVVPRISRYEGYIADSKRHMCSSNSCEKRNASAAAAWSRRDASTLFQFLRTAGSLDRNRAPLRRDSSFSGQPVWLRSFMFRSLSR